MTAVYSSFEFRTDDSGPRRDGYRTVGDEFVEDLDVPVGACTSRGALAVETDCPHCVTPRAP